MTSTDLIGQRSPLHPQVNIVRDIDSGGATVGKMVGREGGGEEGRGGGSLFQIYSSSEQTSFVRTSLLTVVLPPS